MLKLMNRFLQRLPPTLDKRLNMNQSKDIIVLHPTGHLVSVASLLIT